MQEILVTLGVVAVMAAIVGGGLKAAGVEMPVLSSLRRQMLLAVFGLALIAVALEPWANGNDGDGDGEADRVVVAVPATQEWVSTDVDLEAGDVLSITSDGEIRDDVNNNPDRRFTPEGAADPAGEHPGDPHQGFNHAALVGRIGDGEVVKIGADLRCRVTERGRLYLGINDGLLDDNDGEYTATILVSPRAAGESVPRCTPA